MINYGLLRDLLDMRDYTPQSKEVENILGKQWLSFETTLPSQIDLRNWTSPVEDQKNLGSCTAQAVVGLVEFYERKYHNEFIDASRLFLYKVTRKLYNFTGDSGAYIRGTMKALKIFGVPPERYWPYIIEKFDDEPDPFVYSLAKEYQAITYFRLDKSDVKRDDLLFILKNVLFKEIPFVFGFSVYTSIHSKNVSKTGYIPFPRKGEKMEGGHAVMAIGYDDTRRVFIIKNSWSKEWGDNGYGYLPYDYILKGLSADFWCLTKQEYVTLQDL